MTAWNCNTYLLESVVNDAISGISEDVLWIPHDWRLVHSCPADNFWGAFMVQNRAQ
jgi:hypothetical protein